MDGRQGLESDNRALRRIVAILLAMAGLAERATSRPLAIRLLVLWALRRAQFAARMLFDIPPDETGRWTSRQTPAPLGMDDDTIGCALLQLGASLRAMAWLLLHACPDDGLCASRAPRQAVISMTAFPARLARRRARAWIGVVHDTS